MRCLLFLLGCLLGYLLCSSDGSIFGLGGGWILRWWLLLLLLLLLLNMRMIVILWPVDLRK